MALFRFIAAERGESPQELLIEADNREEAVNRLRGRHLVPVRYLGEEEMSGNSGSLFRRRKKQIDTFGFTRQLAPLLSAYVPLERALAIIAESAEKADQKEFVNSLRQGLHEGKKFSELIRSHGSLFPDYYANLIESGEETGCLPEVLNHLYKFMSESKELRDFMVSSSIYPAVILCVTVLVTILMFTVFVPKFAKIFEDMGRALPPSMEFLMMLSSGSVWFVLLLIAAVFGVIGVRRWIGKEKFQYHTSRMLLSVPVIGSLSADLEMCRYVRTLAIMIANHVEIIRTVRISGRIIHNPVIAATFAPVADKLKSGLKLSAALKENPYVPKEMTPMLRVGEESGTVGDMLARIADNLEADTRLRIKRLLSLFEPAVIVFLAAMVLVVVASIFIAMMDINSINTQGGPRL